MTILEKLEEFLDKNGVVYKRIDHGPTPTSEESAKARGESMDIGGKALLVKSNGVYSLFIIRASKKLSSKKLRKQLNSKSIRFADGDELFKLTGLIKGAIPPFGEPILPFRLFIDQTIYRNERIAFNAGSLYTSFILSVEDYLRVAGGTPCDVAEETIEI